MRTIKLALATIVCALAFQAADAQVRVGVHIGTPPPPPRVVGVNRPVVVRHRPVVYARPVVVRRAPVVVVGPRGPVGYRRVSYYGPVNHYYNRPHRVIYRR